MEKIIALLVTFLNVLKMQVTQNSIIASKLYMCVCYPVPKQLSRAGWMLDLWAVKEQFDELETY